MKIIENLLTNREKNETHDTSGGARHHICAEGISIPGTNNELAFDGTGVKERVKGVEIIPSAGFVVKTRILSDGNPKLFINVASSDLLVAPHKKVHLDDENKEVEGLSVPMAVGPLRKSWDRVGESSVVVDCVAHPSVIDKAINCTTGQYRDFVCQLVMQYVEQKYGKTLDSKYRLPRIRYQGYVDVNSCEPVDKKHPNASVCKQWVRNERTIPLIAEVEGYKQPTNICKNKLNLELFIENTSGVICPIGEFLEQIQSSEKSLQNCLSIFDHDGTRPSLLRTLLMTVPDHVKSLHAHVKVSRSVCRETDVHVSAFMVSIETRGCNKCEVVLPFACATKTTTCAYDDCLEMFRISMDINKSPIDSQPDPGTNQWNLQHLMGKFLTKDNTALRHDKHLVRDNINDMEVNIDEIELPEDRFHSKDFMSQHMLELQAKERQGKHDRSVELLGTGEMNSELDISTNKPPPKILQWSELWPDKQPLQIGLATQPCFEAHKKALSYDPHIQACVCRLVVD